MNIYMNILYIYLCKQIYFIFIYHIFIPPLWSTCLRRASLHWFAHFRSANLYCCAHITIIYVVQSYHHPTGVVFRLWGLGFRVYNVEFGP